MGIYLSSPDTRKINTEGSGNGVKFGSSCMQGWRLNMEDAEITQAVFTPNSSLFAVFDGHGGTEVAKYCEKYFGDELKKNKKFSTESNIEEALKETFLKMDQMLFTPEAQAELKTLKTDQDGAESFAGCTANVILIHKNVIYCANAGDSRTICYSNRRVVDLSTDHKPDNEIEKNRIQKAGGFIIEGRVNGNLNLSRALGDLEYKKNPSLKPEEQLISAMPDIVKRPIKKEDAFLVMGCDGIWERLTQEEICQMVDAKFSDGKTKLTAMADEILDKGLAPDTSQGLGCDNMSSIVIKLNC